MKFYKDLDKRKEIIREYIKKNPAATFREIKKDLQTKVNKVYKRGMDEAYEDVGITKPRTLIRMIPEEKKKILFDYIRKNPKAGGQTIRKDTKINFLTIFKNTEEMFKAAGIIYSRKDLVSLRDRDIHSKREEIIKAVKDNPLMNIDKIGVLVRTHPYSVFKNTRDIYTLAGIPFLDKSAKRRMKKQDLVISFIKQNPFSTQRDINSACKTHVQLIFKRGIFEAYERANINFPYERIKLHGTAIKSIKDDARRLEEEIALKLSGFGSVNRLVKTKRGFADIVLERKGKKAIIEVKNYKSHEISISQIKQLNRYLEDTKTPIGFLVCLKKPKKDTFLMGENKIVVVLDSELSKIPEFMDL